MAGVSTGVSLLSTSNLKLPDLSYSTTSVINNQWGGLVTKTFTASPDPDQFGNTGFVSNSSVGLSFTSSSGSVYCVQLDNTWPSYNVRHNLAGSVWGNYTSTITPVIKDSGGVVGTTQGSYTCDLTRAFTWTRAGVQANAETTYGSTQNSSTLTIGLLVSDYSYPYSNFSSANCTIVEGVGGDVSGTPTVQRDISVTTLGENVINEYLQVKAEHVSGDTTWEIVVPFSGTIRTKGVYYSANSNFIRLNPRSTSGTTSSVIRITFNHPNSGNTYSKDITLSLTKP